MSLAKGTINPLNVLGLRKLHFIPKHFKTIKIVNTLMFQKIDHWIYFNLNSRYCMEIKQGINKHRKITDICVIGLEDPKELTILSLSCPHLHGE
jgi:hypothetical protein